jgi:hypothetical protein
MLETGTEFPQTTPTSNPGIVPFAGESMLPLLKPGDRLWVRYFSNQEFTSWNEGDLALLYDGQECVIHRCIASTPDLKFKGDHSLHIDSHSTALGKILGIDQREFWGEASPPLAKLAVWASRAFAAQTPRPLRQLVRAFFISACSLREKFIFLKIVVFNIVFFKTY